MFSKIKAWFMGEVATAESILARFEAHAAAEMRKVFHLDTVIADAKAAQAVAAAEVAKATAAAAAIKNAVVNAVEPTPATPVAAPVAETPAAPTAPVAA